eukprot:scaffold160309_cov57-Attheya_sp.AAC.4
MNDLCKEASADKKKSYNQLRPVFFRLLLNAPSIDGSNTTVDPSFNAQSFYECKTVGATKIHLDQ